VIGRPGNLDGIGTQIRAVAGERLGPIRELHAGGGYWSQDAAVQVLGAPGPPTGIWLRWPGGATNQFEVPAGAREISVSRDGIIQVR
jgi:hypothetical protein